MRERKRGAFWSILHLAGREGGGEVTAAVRARHLLYSRGGVPMCRDPRTIGQRFHSRCAQEKPKVEAQCCRASDV